MIWLLVTLTAIAIMVFLFAPLLRSKNNHDSPSKIWIFTGISALIIVALYILLGRPEFTGKNEEALSARLQLLSGDYDKAMTSYKTLGALMPDNENLQQEIQQAEQIIMQNEQQAQINAMVEGLADRLYNEGGTPEEWARLLRSRWVLDQRDLMARDFNLVKQIFKDEPETIDRIIEMTGQAQ